MFEQRDLPLDIVLVLGVLGHDAPEEKILLKVDERIIILKLKARHPNTEQRVLFRKWAVYFQKQEPVFFIQRDETESRHAFRICWAGQFHDQRGLDYLKVSFNPLYLETDIWID